jgi:hypothetical protein
MTEAFLSQLYNDYHVRIKFDYQGAKEEFDENDYAMFKFFAEERSNFLKKGCKDRPWWLDASIRWDHELWQMIRNAKYADIHTLFIELLSQGEVSTKERQVEIMCVVYKLMMKKKGWLESRPNVRKIMLKQLDELITKSNQELSTMYQYIRNKL